MTLECGTTINRLAHPGASRPHVRKPKSRDSLQSMPQRSQAAYAPWRLALARCVAAILPGRLNVQRRRLFTLTLACGTSEIAMFSSIGPPPARTILPTSYSGDAPAGAKKTSRRVGCRRATRSRRLLRRTSTGLWRIGQSWCRPGFHPNKPRSSSCGSSAAMRGSSSTSCGRCDRRCACACVCVCAFGVCVCVCVSVRVCVCARA